jgi:subtilisin family serine protease
MYVCNLYIYVYIVSNTHCIGTALGRNGVGVAPEAALLVGKVLSDSGSGSSDGIARGVRWAVDEGADIISMSLGGGSSYGPTNDAIDYAFSKGVIVNVAAGNSGFNGRNTIGWPAKHLGSLCCGAYRVDGRIASFSSGGREMDWACPGEGIVSFSNDGRSYTTKSGTSMATPFGSGVLALLVEVSRRQGDAQWKSVDAVRQFFAANLKDGGAPGEDPLFGKGFPVVDDFITALLNKTLTWF